MPHTLPFWKAIAMLAIGFRRPAGNPDRDLFRRFAETLARR